MFNIMPKAEQSSATHLSSATQIVYSAWLKVQMAEQRELTREDAFTR